MRTPARSIIPIALFSAALTSLMRTADADERQPDQAMKAPVNAVRDFMITLDRRHLSRAFVTSGAVIFEDFAPYVFEGKGAVSRWSAAFVRKSSSEKLSNLHAEFASGRNFESSGNRVFFVLPTTWTGSEKHRFVETGTWSFVLVKFKSEWRIKSYAWAVNTFQYTQ